MKQAEQSSQPIPLVCHDSFLFIFTDRSAQLIGILQFLFALYITHSHHAAAEDFAETFPAKVLFQTVIPVFALLESVPLRRQNNPDSR